MLIIILLSHLNDLWIVISMLEIEKEGDNGFVSWIFICKLFDIVFDNCTCKMIYCASNGLNNNIF